jgi:hypothetical protein
MLKEMNQPLKRAARGRNTAMAASDLNFAQEAFSVRSLFRCCIILNTLDALPLFMACNDSKNIS